VKDCKIWSLSVWGGRNSSRGQPQVEFTGQQLDDGHETTSVPLPRANRPVGAIGPIDITSDNFRSRVLYLRARVRFQSPGVARIAEVAQGDPNVRCYSLGAAVSRPLVRGPCAMRARPTEAVSRLRRVRRVPDHPVLKPIADMLRLERTEAPVMLCPASMCRTGQRHRCQNNPWDCGP
jgi:hypothetical protein